MKNALVYISIFVLGWFASSLFSSGSGNREYTVTVISDTLTVTDTVYKRNTTIITAPAEIRYFEYRDTVEKVAVLDTAAPAFHAHIEYYTESDTFKTEFTVTEKTIYDTTIIRETEQITEVVPPETSYRFGLGIMSNEYLSAAYIDAAYTKHLFWNMSAELGARAIFDNNIIPEFTAKLQLEL